MKLTNFRVFWGTVLIAIAIVWSVSVFAGHVPDECAGSGHPSEEACRYLLVLRYWIQTAFDWVRTSDNDKIVVAFGTGAIAVFTGTLWLSTHRLWQASQDQSRDMKESIAIAKRAADAALLGVSSDRAWLLPEKPIVGDADDFYVGGTFQKRGIVGRLRWANFGRSPAIEALRLCRL